MGVGLGLGFSLAHMDCYPITAVWILPCIHAPSAFCMVFIALHQAGLSSELGLVGVAHTRVHHTMVTLGLNGVHAGQGSG